MKESNWTSKLLSELRCHPILKDAVIYKHNDYYTSGVPDFSITYNGHTEWFEIKIHPNTPTPLQTENLKRLQPTSHLITYFSNEDIQLDNVHVPFKRLIPIIVCVATNQLNALEMVGDELI